MKDKGIILLSGGLDSLVSLGLGKDKYSISLALTFDYGQKSFKNEYEASKKICKYYKIEHKVITLDWLKNITNTGLVGDNTIPTDGNFSKESKSAVWVPNRNGLFLNIAGCFADSFKFNYILIGANKEEAQTFSDNSKEFIESINEEFEFSTENKPKVIAPLVNLDKTEIVKHALENNIPLEFTNSCYLSGDKNCGKCESCRRLRNALEKNNALDFIKKLF